MGEEVWYRRLRVGVEWKNKAETEWSEGIWLGPAIGSSETLIGMKDNVIRASAIKRTIHHNGGVGNHCWKCKGPHNTPTRASLASTYPSGSGWTSCCIFRSRSDAVDEGGRQAERCVCQTDLCREVRLHRRLRRLLQTRSRNHTHETSPRHAQNKCMKCLERQTRETTWMGTAERQDGRRLGPPSEGDCRKEGRDGARDGASRKRRREREIGIERTTNLRSRRSYTTCMNVTSASLQHEKSLWLYQTVFTVLMGIRRAWWYRYLSRYMSNASTRSWRWCN